LQQMSPLFDALLELALYPHLAGYLSRNQPTNSSAFALRVPLSLGA